MNLTKMFTGLLALGTTGFLWSKDYTKCLIKSRYTKARFSSLRILVLCVSLDFNVVWVSTVKSGMFPHSF